jgi:hypothetical protein
VLLNLARRAAFTVRAALAAARLGIGLYAVVTDQQDERRKEEG